MGTLVKMLFVYAQEVRGDAVALADDSLQGAFGDAGSGRRRQSGGRTWWWRSAFWSIRQRLSASVF
ncbi:hypothetical protein [Kitasatospora sp. NPDC002040]|uniref:hypothetical protein n=1 Tax=Kitasatospora sp. NPDC002040 TaxID=3154661 RepID=UPI00333493A0